MATGARPSFRRAFFLRNHLFLHPSSNIALALIDFNPGEKLEEVSTRIVNEIIAVANTQETKAERGKHHEFALSRMYKTVVIDSISKWHDHRKNQR